LRRGSGGRLEELAERTGYLVEGVPVELRERGAAAFTRRASQGCSGLRSGFSSFFETELRVKHAVVVRGSESKM
jgi:hypothetical protein